MIVRIEPYDSKIHETLLRAWLVARRIVDPTLLKTLPQMGVVAFDDTEAVACAFLRTCEGGVGILEGLISNPVLQSHVRHLAIEACVQHILSIAKALKYNSILAYSVDEGTLERSKQHGFSKMPHTLITCKLGE